MAETLRYVPPTSIITGWDFSTGAVKCLAFDLDGKVVAEVRYPPTCGPKAASPS